MTIIHIHAPRATAKTTRAVVCPDCKRWTRLLQFFTPWYGWDMTCIRCGREWMDGEWTRLCFEPQSRQKSIARAKALWRAMPPKTENHYGIDG